MRFNLRQIAVVLFVAGVLLGPALQIWRNQRQINRLQDELHRAAVRTAEAEAPPWIPEEAADASQLTDNATE